MNDTLNTKLKFLTFSMAILIIVAVITLAILVIKKNKSNKQVELQQSNTDISKNIYLLEQGLPRECIPYEFVFKEHYIAIYSKSCHILKVLKTFN